MPEASMITKMLWTVFPSLQNEFRCLIIGNDGSGKTTILYKWKLGEVVSTIPTIGFNVETIEHQGNGLVMWDVGGCDKIRPLWRHYYQGTRALIYVVDSVDQDRLTNPSETDKWGVYADSGLRELLKEEELKDAIILVLCTKQDKPNSMSGETIGRALALSDIEASGRSVRLQECSAVTGDGLQEGLTWLVCTLKHLPEPLPAPVVVDASTGEVLPPPTAEEVEAARMEAMLQEWLERDDLPDEEFLSRIEDASFDVWDHYTHLRIAWLVLTKYGRREGVAKIFQLIKHFIEVSPRTKRSDTTRGTTFHETMTYFWVHMTHYAIAATKNPTGTFKTFLLLNPQLSNGGLFLHYYSKKRMLLSAESRSSVILPDILPLPSLLSEAVGHSPDSQLPVEVRLQPREPVSDADFLQSVRCHQQAGWGHDVLMRLIYVLLIEQMYGVVSTEESTASTMASQLSSLEITPVPTEKRRRSADDILDVIKDIEKEHFHLTINYFWIQMVTYHIAVIEKKTQELDPETGKSSSGVESFDVFYRHPECQRLRNAQLIEKHYSKAVLYTPAATSGLVLPDVKPLPSAVYG